MKEKNKRSELTGTWTMLVRGCGRLVQSESCQLESRELRSHTEWQSELSMTSLNLSQALRCIAIAYQFTSDLCVQ